MRALPAKVRCPSCAVKSIITEDNVSAGRNGHARVPVGRSPGPDVPLSNGTGSSGSDPFDFHRADADYLLPATDRPRSQLAVGLSLVLALVVLIAGVTLAVVYFAGDSPTEPAARNEIPKPEPAEPRPKPEPRTKPLPRPTEPAPAPEPLSPDPLPRPRPTGPLPPDFVPEIDPNAPKPKPPGPDPDLVLQEMFGKVSPELQEKINKAIERGVDYLRTKDRDISQIKIRKGGRVGYLSLAGLTLLECGVPPDDELVTKLAESVREAEPQINQTYAASVAILFLDRYGDPRDRDIIRGLAARLAAGQNGRGGWTYQIPLLSLSDGETLLDALERLPQPKLATGQKAQTNPEDPASSPDEKMERPARVKPITLEAIPKALREYAVVQYKLGTALNLRGAGVDDHSNTQFAILALWVARRHDVPVARTFAMVDRRFRASQRDGAWAYQLAGSNWKDTGACAGLIGLGACRGIGLQVDAAKPDSDPAIEKAIEYIGKRLGEIDEKGPTGKPRTKRGVERIVGADSHGDLYFLWSLERVSVAYHLKAYADREWYPWGAKLLVDSQEEDGSWSDQFAGIPDTCFALLFLKKANIARDLTTELKKINLPLTVRPEGPKPEEPKD